MRKDVSFYNRISTKLLIVLLILFSIAAISVSIINRNNIRNLYEDNFTERALLTNALMATIIESEDVNYYVDLIKNQSSEFKQKQIQYYHDRLVFWDLKGKDAKEEELYSLSSNMKAFHKEVASLKTDRYWKTIELLKELKEVSNSTYLYVMADTGLVNKDGEKLYTFIFDADDEASLYMDAPDIDGLGTSDVSQDTIITVYETKKQMDHVVYYNDVYGELYYAFAPILNKNGDVIAVFGSDIGHGKLHDAIASSTLLFNTVFFATFIFIIFILFIYLHRSIIAPLGSLTNTAHALAEGNIYAPTPESTLKQQSEIGVLAHAVNDMSVVYQNMMRDAGGVFAAANIGKLNFRSDQSKFKGDIARFIEQINDTLDATTLYLNSLPESIFIMSKDFEIYFRNHLFSECFGDMTAMEIMSLLFPVQSEMDAQSRTAFLKTQVADVLKEKNNNAEVWINNSCFSFILKEIDLDDMVENSILVIAIDITSLMKEREIARAAAEAKSSFLSRMSHEMRTPMNAIIGMTKIAEDTQDISKLKYCLGTIDTSSRHLLGIINDVLDMSKIEAGKFELENIPLNIEKMLMKVCTIVMDNIEKKRQKFNVRLSRDLDLNYMEDELRLSQVITNVLSNAVKFTQDLGKITLSVKKIGHCDNKNTLLFSIADNGIGMTEEQISRLWGAFEQADGSVSRKYGGTGLGLSISKNIIEKMNGRIWAESEPGVGTTLSFEISLERASHQHALSFDGIRPEDIKLLIVESDDEVRERFLSIIHGFNMTADAAQNSDEALALVESAYNTKRAYDIIFLDYNMRGMNGFEVVKRLNGRIDKNTVIIITTFLEWHQIEKEAAQINITRYIVKPLFPSSILDTINNIVGKKLKSFDKKVEKAHELPDFSGAHIILAEDVEINREIVLALLEPTNIRIDCAANGAEAVDMFTANPEKYDIIFMDIQMPEMDGYTATKKIRASCIEKAGDIPIIAMTANVFREDIENCLAAGMNDHIGKPVDQNELFIKIERHLLHI